MIFKRKLLSHLWPVLVFINIFLLLKSLDLTSQTGFLTKLHHFFPLQKRNSYVERWSANWNKLDLRNVARCRIWYVCALPIILHSYGIKHFWKLFVQNANIRVSLLLRSWDSILFKNSNLASGSGTISSDPDTIQKCMIPANPDPKHWTEVQSIGVDPTTSLSHHQHLAVSCAGR